jgi:outer membrane protein TolC
LCSFSSIAQTKNLDDFIAVGLANSPILKDYKNQVLAYKLDSQLIRATLRPQIYANGQAAYYPVINGYGYDNAITNGGNYSALLGASQNIFTRNLSGPQYRNIQIQTLGSVNTTKISGHDLNRNITTQYLTAYTDYSLLEFTKLTYKLLNDELQVLKKLVESGIYKQVSYFSFRIEVQSLALALKQNELQYRRDVSDLKALCGMNDTILYKLEKPDITINDLKDIEASPQFYQFRIDSLRILNSKEIINIRYRPKLGWFADAGLMTSNPAMINKNFGTSFGLNFSVPIYDGHQKKLEYQKISLAENTRSNYSSFYRAQFGVHIAEINKEFELTNKLITQMQEQLKEAQTLINVSKLELNRGDLPITDFILAIRSYVTINSSLNQTLIRQLQLINEYNYWYW